MLAPATTAKMALALAALVPVEEAVIGERIAGQRTGRELAKALRRTWGMRCVSLADVELALGDEAAAAAFLTQKLQTIS